jgi:Xaa-Pro aminopeptidase
MERKQRLRGLLDSCESDIFVTTQRPNQLYLLDHPNPTKIISRPNCFAIIFGLDKDVVFPGFWISNACRDLLNRCNVIENRMGDRSPNKQLIDFLGSYNHKKIVVDEPSLGEEIKEAIPNFKVIVKDIGGLLRRKKDEKDLVGLREAARVADLGITSAFAAIKPGVSCADIAAEGEYVMRKAGAEDVSMAPAVGQGTYYLDSAEDVFRTVREGDMVFIDLAIRVKGYLGDITRAGIVGRGTVEQRLLLDTVRRAYAIGYSHMSSGSNGDSIYKEVAQCFAQHGWEDYFLHHLSHGLGLGGDRPKISRGGSDILEVGDTLSCEPGIYIPGLGGARIENMIHIGDQVTEELTQSSLDLPMGF